MTLFARLVSLARPQFGAFAVSGLLGLVVSALYVAGGVLVALALERLVGGAPLASVALLVALAVAALALRALAILAYQARAAAAAADVKISLRERLYRHVVALGPRWASAARTGAVQGMLTDGVDALERVYSGLLVQTAVSVVSGVAIGVVILTIDPVIGVIVLAALVALPLLVVVSQVVLRGTGDLWWRRYGELQSAYVDHLQGIVTLKVLGASRRSGEALDVRARLFRDAAIATMGREGVLSAAAATAAGVGSALSVGIGALRVADDRLGLTELFLVLFLARECFRPLTDLTRGFHLAYYGIVVARPVLELLDTRPAVADDGRRHLRGGDAGTDAAAPAVRFEGVSFAYPAPPGGAGAPGSDPPTEVLTGLDLEVGAGETVALVGRSGAGKSTVAMLLLRFFDPTSGRITVDGVDVRELPLERLRSMISLVAQDTHLYAGSVRENLTLARGDAGDDVLWDALEAASAAGFVRALPDGLDTVIGERGVKLSGGERQRLAIARALVKDAPILVLDEATSSVDVASEGGIQVALDRLRRGRTTLVIAHRLSTVRGADRIVVLDGGRVAEAGRHDELVAAGGSYGRLVSAGARGRGGRR